jgi:hypothetical protein
MSPLVAEIDLSLAQADRKNTKNFAKKRAKYRCDKLNQQSARHNDDLQQVCRALLRLAQRYLPANPSAISDAVELVHCIKMLQKMGIVPDVADKFKAALSSTGCEIVLSTTEYRGLRNKCIAGFATIADLTEKPAAVGTPEFQRGVREGYRRASDIAVMFLEDIQGHTPC